MLGVSPEVSDEVVNHCPHALVTVKKRDKISKVVLVIQTTQLAAV